MGKVVKFPGPAPEKFGLQRVRKKKGTNAENHGQLPLFGGAKILRLNHLSSFEEGLLQDDNDNLKAAKELYQKAIDEGDCLADAYCNLGIIESGDGNLAKAMDCFTKSLKLDPRHYEAHYNLANLYSEVGNYILAKFHYGIAIEIEPTFPNSYFNLGLALAMTKEFGEAVRQLHAYRRLSSGEDDSYTNDLIKQLTIV